MRNPSRWPKKAVRCFPSSFRRQNEAVGTELAAMLKRMTGAEFAIETSAEPHGIYLGLNDDARMPSRKREEYTLRSEKGCCDSCSTPRRWSMRCGICCIAWLSAVLSGQDVGDRAADAFAEH